MNQSLMLEQNMCLVSQSSQHRLASKFCLHYEHTSTGASCSCLGFSAASSSGAYMSLPKTISWLIKAVASVKRSRRERERNRADGSGRTKRHHAIPISLSASCGGVTTNRGLCSSLNVPCQLSVVFLVRLVVNEHL